MSRHGAPNPRAELEKLAQHDKPALESRKSAAPAAKPKKSQGNGAPGEAATKTDEVKEPVAKAA